MNLARVSSLSSVSIVCFKSRKKAGRRVLLWTLTVVCSLRLSLARFASRFATRWSHIDAEIEHTLQQILPSLDATDEFSSTGEEDLIPFYIFLFLGGSMLVVFAPVGSTLKTKEFQSQAEFPLPKHNVAISPQFVFNSFMHNDKIHGFSRDWKTAMLTFCYFANRPPFSADIQREVATSETILCKVSLAPASMRRPRGACGTLWRGANNLHHRYCPRTERIRSVDFSAPRGYQLSRKQQTFLENIWKWGVAGWSETDLSSFESRLVRWNSCVDHFCWSLGAALSTLWRGNQYSAVQEAVLPLLGNSGSVVAVRWDPFPYPFLPECNFWEWGFGLATVINAIGCHKVQGFATSVSAGGTVLDAAQIEMLEVSKQASGIEDLMQRHASHVDAMPAEVFQHLSRCLWTDSGPGCAFVRASARSRMGQPSVFYCELVHHCAVECEATDLVFLRSGAT